jgi:hypothetical protein
LANIISFQCGNTNINFQSKHPWLTLRMNENDWCKIIIQ